MSENTENEVDEAEVKPAKKARKPRAKSNGERATRKVDLSKLDQFGFRLGSKKAQAAAMYASKKGATLAEVRGALQSTQFNLLTEIEKRGFKIERMPATGEHDRKVTRFHIAGR